MEPRRHERSAVTPEAFEALRAHVERQDAVIDDLNGTIAWLMDIVMPKRPSGRTVKQVSIDTHFSESAIRKWLHARPEGERYVRHGAHLYVVEDALRPEWRKNLPPAGGF